MAWVRDEIGRVVALPREIGGIPLDEIGEDHSCYNHPSVYTLENSCSTD